VSDNSDVILIGIAGASASGKTLMANTIVEELGSEQVAIISEDSYYKDLSGISFEERSKINYDHPDALDHDLMHEHMQKLLKREPIEVPIYDYNEHLRSKSTRTINNHRIVVFEGILLFVDPEIRKQLQIQIFMDTPLDICLLRRLKRDIKERNRDFDSVLEQYEQTVRPMYHQFIEPSKKHADIIVPRGGNNRIAIDMIKAKMREMLGGK
jgi:uridine kinase